MSQASIPSPAPVSPWDPAPVVFLALPGLAQPRQSSADQRRHRDRPSVSPPALPAPMFDQHAGIHDDPKPRRTRTCGSRLVNDAELHPDGLGADGDGLFDDRGNLLGTTENEHEIDRFGHGQQIGIGLFAQTALHMRIDRDDAIPLFAQIRRNVVAGAFGPRGETDDGDGAGFGEDGLDGVIAIHSSVGRAR